MYRLFFVGWLILCLPVGLLAQTSSTGAGRQVVEELTTVLIDVMKNAEEMGYQGRYKKLEPIIRKTHSLSSIAKFSVGKHWRTLDEEQQSKFVEIFSDYSIATYAYRFNGYSKEKFNILSEEPLKRNKVLVRSMFEIPDEQDIKFDFILNNNDGKSQIINIIHDGISDLALKRAQYTSIIDRDGFPALLTKLAEKIAMYEEKTNTARTGSP